MKPFARSDRVAGQIQKALSHLILKEIKDPRIETVTLTGVEVSRDLRIARIYYSVTGGENVRKGAAEGFNRALGFLKRTLASRLGLRYMPDLKFFYDDSFDYGSRIDTVLRSIKSGNGSDNSSTE
jgi:ribosome-binding factor A